MAVIPQWSEEELDESLLEISDEVLAERMARVEPLILKNDNLYRFIKRPDPRNIAFTWGPEDSNLVLVDPRTEEDESGGLKALDCYVEVGRGFTYHSCGYVAFVKPTLADVYAQMPDNDRITAFYLDTGSARGLHDGAGHVINVYWLTNKPIDHEFRRARYARKYPDRENIYE
jgi:hypothetical protein